MTVAPYFSTWRDQTLHCRCDWTGRAGDLKPEMHSELMDLSCPECDQMLLIVPYPTVAEVEQAAAAGDPEAMGMRRPR